METDNLKKAFENYVKFATPLVGRQGRKILECEYNTRSSVYYTEDEVDELKRLTRIIRKSFDELFKTIHENAEFSEIIFCDVHWKGDVFKIDDFEWTVDESLKEADRYLNMLYRKDGTLFNNAIKIYVDYTKSIIERSSAYYTNIEKETSDKLMNDIFYEFTRLIHPIHNDINTLVINLQNEFNFNNHESPDWKVDRLHNMCKYYLEHLD